MMKITGLSHLFKWENLHNWWLTKYFFAPLYIAIINVSVFLISPVPIAELLTSELIDTPVFHNLAPRPNARFRYPSLLVNYVILFSFLKKLKNSAS